MINELYVWYVSLAWSCAFSFYFLTDSFTPADQTSVMNKHHLCNGVQ